MSQVKVKGSARLFKNPFIEALTHTNPYITFIAYAPLIVLMFVIGVYYYEVPVGRSFGILVFAVFFWTFSEYMLHRYLYHWVNDSKVVQRFHYMMHGAHHEYPKDLTRLFMPPVPGYLMAGLFYVIFLSVFTLLGLGGNLYPFYAGFMIGYMIYVYTHWAIHRFKRPKNKYGYIWDHHNIHHFKSPDKAFGVSSPFWDHVFKTMPKR
jgi:4-hydroxysphinganine ceramide fatty acyl 2-hydroxylase